MRTLALGVALTVAASGCLRLVEPSDLQGTWVATSVILSDADNPSNSIDLLDESDVAFLSFTFDLNIYRSRVVSFVGGYALFDMSRVGHFDALGLKS